MDFEKAFTYISEDEAWLKKLLVGAILSVVPFVNFAIFGYQVQIARNVAAGEKRPLPDWSEFGQFFMDGLRLMGAFFVYSLPMMLLFFIAAGSMVIFAESASQGYDAYGDPASPAFFIIFGVMFACLMPYMFLLYAMYPMFGIQIAREGSFGSCFKFSEMWRLIRAQLVNYLLILALLFGLYMVTTFIMLPAYLLILIPCLGYIAYMAIYGGLMMLIMMVIGHLQGQFISEDNAQMEIASDFAPETW
jgi:hypothetical protein